MKTLTVTSPLMKGADVRVAQRALAKSKYGSYYRGEIDGEFGPLSASASKDARFWLGFEVANIRPFYGEALHEFLRGDVDLTGPMEKRRKARMARPPEERLRKDALDIAISQIGISESPRGSNNTKYCAWYGMGNVAWCFIFVSWCSVQAGLNAFDRGDRWAYCPFGVADARAGRNGLRARGASEAPQPGDLVFYDWSMGSGDIADHVGFFEKGTRSSFTAIEGNVDSQVLRKQRDSSTVRLFAYAVR